MPEIVPVMLIGMALVSYQLVVLFRLAGLAKVALTLRLKSTNSPSEIAAAPLAGAGQKRPLSPLSPLPPDNIEDDNLLP